FIQVGLVPGVNTNDAREITRVELIYEHAFVFGDNVEAALAPEGFESSRQRLKLCTRPRGLLRVDRARQHLDIFPAIVARPDLRDAPLTVVAFGEAKGRLDLRHDYRR